MSIHLLPFAASMVGALTAGWLLGRRSYRRQLQTSNGRQRAGARRLELVDTIEQLLADPDDVPTTELRAITPQTRPAHVVIPVPR